MLILSDGRERLAVGGSGGSGSEVTVDSLSSGDQVLWRALGTDQRLWLGDGPDPSFPGFWSRALIVAEASGSLFDRMKEIVTQGPILPGPTACVALSGRGFHGQRGRPWLAAPGNLHLCAAFPEPNLAVHEARALPMLSAVALVEAVRAMTGGALRPGIKWVNDVLLEGRKIGGVLTTSHTQGNRVRAVLVGIGLNVATAPPVAPTPFVPSVGCLAEAGSRVPLAHALACVLAALGRRMTELVSHGAGTLFDAYRDASLVIGRDVCIFPESVDEETPLSLSSPPVVRGIVREIAPDLSLVLEGAESPVTSGRLAFAESCRRFGP
jgi:BirA family transcriptional regulator, biotin operon repressor / biotin---[acetyl-CoA-carboxylase] ligase